MFPYTLPENLALVAYMSEAAACLDGMSIEKTFFWREMSLIMLGRCRGEIGCSIACKLEPQFGSILVCTRQWYSFKSQLTRILTLESNWITE